MRDPVRSGGGPTSSCYVKFILLVRSDNTNVVAPQVMLTTPAETTPELQPYGHC